MMGGIDRRGLIAAAAALAAIPARAAAPARRFAMDSLATDDPGFDAGAVREAGTDAAIIDIQIYPRNRQAALDALESWRRASIAPGAGFVIAGNVRELLAARDRGKFGVVLASQDASILDSSTYSVSDANLANLEEFHARGLRVLQMTHNERNAVGDSFQSVEDAGLSRLGFAVVERMNALGMLVDLSHCGDRTTAQAIAHSKRPCAVTHAGCRALYPSGRNKTDETIRALAQGGGYFGIYMMSRWLTARATASVADIADHIDHAVNIGGIETVGFGSDQPLAGDTTPQAEKVAALAAYQKRNAGIPGADPIAGHITAPDMDRAERMRILEHELNRRGYRGDRLDKLMGGNVLRILGTVIG